MVYRVETTSSHLRSVTNILAQIVLLLSGRFAPIRLVSCQYLSPVLEPHGRAYAAHAPLPERRSPRTCLSLPGKAILQHLFFLLFVLRFQTVATAAHPQSRALLFSLTPSVLNLAAPAPARPRPLRLPRAPFASYRRTAQEK